MSNFKLFVGDNTNKAKYVGSLLPDQEGNAGKFLITDGTTASWTSVTPGESGDTEKELPDQTGNSGKFLTTNGSETSWVNVSEVPDQTGNSGKFLTTNGSTSSWTDINLLPDQTGNSGKVLSTNGTEAYWNTIITLPSQFNNSGKFLTTDGTTASWGDALVNRGTGISATAVGSYASAINRFATSFGANATATAEQSTALGESTSATAEGSTAVGYYATVSAENAIQLGRGINSDTNTFKVANANNNFELMSADGTIPTDRYTTTPTDSGTYVPKLTIAEDGTATREWGTESSGSTSLPDQTNNAGKFLTTDGSNMFWNSVNIETSVRSEYDSENKRLTLL